MLGYKRHVKGNEPEYIQFVSEDELLAQSDIVSLHCPLNEESKGMINKDTIAKMKKGALLMNAARGPVVDSQALADALNSGYLGGAGIDVFENEPPLALDHPLLHSKNTIVTPPRGICLCGVYGGALQDRVQQPAQLDGRPSGQCDSVRKLDSVAGEDREAMGPSRLKNLSRREG